MKNNTILLRLSLCEGIGPALIAQLLPFLPSLTTATHADLRQYGLSSRQATLVHKALRDDEQLIAHDAWLKTTDITVVTLLDNTYPILLKQTTCPPAVLWIRGTLLPTTYTACALVGSRDATRYAQRALKKIIPELVAHNIITVSGGALGVDGWVHEQTISAGGHTAMVAGCGFQHYYPPQHHKLFECMARNGGTLISPFAPWTPPSRGTFPARNRIIAGLSQACVVVQAAQRSGALITASYALDANREVGAIPGPIDDDRSIGSNNLLRQGAHLITSAQDILLCLGSHDHATRTAQSTLPSSSLSDCAQKILAQLDIPTTFDDLVAAGHTDISQLQTLLYELQVAGIITQNHAGFWERHE